MNLIEEGVYVHSVPHTTMDIQQVSCVVVVVVVDVFVVVVLLFSVYIILSCCLSLFVRDGFQCLLI